MERRTLNILWKGKTTRYSIVIPQTATATEKHAANELIRFIGHGLQAVPDCGEGLQSEKAIISLGDTSVFREAKIDLSAVKADGYLIRSFGKTVVIAAKSKAAFSTAHTVSCVRCGGSKHMRPTSSAYPTPSR